MNSNKLKNIFFMCISLLLSISYTIHTKSMENIDDHVRNGVILSSGALGTWVGSGIGYTATRTLAEHLYAKEPGSIIRASTEKAQVSDFVENWGSTGKFIGATAGLGACVYLSTTVYDNYPSWIKSWKKLGNSILNWDFKDIKDDDIGVYAGNGLNLL